jgi:AraC-like DNA-binding protein
MGALDFRQCRALPTRPAGAWKHQFSVGIGIGTARKITRTIFPAMKRIQAFPKKTGMACLLIGCTAAVATGALPGTNREILLVKPVSTVMTMNGILSEWGNADSVGFLNVSVDALKNNRVAVMALWDYQKLYVAFKVHDTQLNAVSIARESGVYRDDCVEVYLSTRPEGAPLNFLGEREYQFLVNLNGAVGTFTGISDKLTTPLWAANRNNSWTADVFAGVRILGTINNNKDIDTGYCVEMAIPWPVIKFTPHSGDTLLVDFCNEDSDPGDSLCYFDWCGLGSRTAGNSFSQPALWKALVLTGYPQKTVRANSATLKNRLPIIGSFVVVAIILSAVWGKRVFRKETTLDTGVSVRVSVPTYPQAITKKALEVLNQRYKTDISVIELSKEVFISERHLQRILKQETGKHFTEMLTDIRMENAKKLLENTDYSATQICFEVGYRSFSHFRRVFKNHSGITAIEYRKSIRPPLKSQ